MMAEIDFDYEYDKVADLLEHRKDGFNIIFEYLRGIEEPVIVETGCAREEGSWGGDGQSSIMFDWFVQSYGGKFYTVDNDLKSVVYTRSKISKKSTCALEDSVSYLYLLNKQLKKENRKIDLLYLDSMDAPKEDKDVCLESAVHHLYEFMTIQQSLNDGALIVIDDNWLENVTVEGAGSLEGKGKIVFEYFRRLGFQPIYAGYQLIWKMF
jgi:hypothetical protein